jgi:hypothetical protein
VTCTPSAANIDAYSTPITPPADDREAARESLEARDVVAGEDDRAVRLDAGWGRGARADRDQHVRRRERALAVRRDDRNRVRIDERGEAVEDRDAVSPQLVLDHGTLAREDVVHAREQLPHARRARAPHPEHGLAEGLARDRPGVEADAAEDAAPLDDGDVAAELCGLHRRALAGRTAPQADEIEVERQVGHATARWTLLQRRARRSIALRKTV